MRILHVITSLDPNQGGPPVVAERLAAAQASLGHGVDVLAYLPSDAEPRFRKAVAAVPGFEHVRVHALPAPPSPLADFVGSAAKAWLAEHINQYDYLHLHGIWNPLLLHAAGAARAAHRPYCIVPHGMLDPWCLWGQSRAKGLKKSLALSLVYKRFINGAAFLHVLNADEGRLMQPLSLTPPTVVLPNGVFMSEVAPLPPPGTFRAAHSELGNDPYILFLSRLHFKKGLDYLVDAFAAIAPRHPRLRVVIAGPDDGVADSIRAQANAANLQDRVHFVGPLYGQDKLGAFVDCACFCLPSRQEGFSMAITEAMVCGKPVVISDQCHFPEVAEVDAGRVVPCGAVPTAQALEQLLGLTPQAATDMGARGRELVSTRFTWPSIAERAIEAYRSFGAPH